MTTDAGLTAAIGARAVAALDACERMRREEATQRRSKGMDAGAAYAYEGGFTFRPSGRIRRRRDPRANAPSTAGRRTRCARRTSSLQDGGRRFERGGRGGRRVDSRRAAPDPATLYSVLRRTNPAPYAAFLCFGGRARWDSSDNVSSDNVSSDPLADVVAVCCSSPERFLRLSASGVLEAKPIKGTAPRVQPLGRTSRLRSSRRRSRTAPRI